MDDPWHEAGIPIGPSGELRARWRMPDSPIGVVIFVHGTGSNRLSSRNAFVAHSFYGLGLGAVVFDLLTADEERQDASLLDVDLLISRVGRVRTWVSELPRAQHLRMGLFGSSTGAALAVASAAIDPAGVGAIVARGGRVDLASRYLPKLTVPTLLIVGAFDEAVMEWNERAAALMSCEHRLEVVPGASHLFAEPGALERAAALAGTWFVEHLAKAA